MKFIKENGYDILRLFINQVGITIFSLVLYTSTSDVFEDDATALRIKVGISIGAMLFYFALLYTATWDIGAKDKIRIDGGRLKKTTYKGALMSLMANSLNFILALVCVISSGILVSSESEAAMNLLQIFNLFLRMLNAMYLGLIQGIFVSVQDNTNLYFFYQSIGYLVAPLLAILSTHLGYFMGLKDKKIFSGGKKKNAK